MEAGYKVSQAADASFAQTLLLSGLAIDVLVSDVKMSGEINGVELAEWVRKHFPHVAIVVATGWVDDHLRERASCFDALLIKPFAEELLVEVVSDLAPILRDENLRTG
jgi:CheY-like chemotaxis protein